MDGDSSKNYHMKVKELGLFKLESIRFMGNIRTIFQYVNARENPERPGQEPNLPEQVGFAFVSVYGTRKITASHPHPRFVSFSAWYSWNQCNDTPMAMNSQGILFPKSPDQDRKVSLLFPWANECSFPIYPLTVSIVSSSHSSCDTYDSLSSSMIFYSLKNFSSTNIFFDHQKSLVKETDDCSHSNMSKDTQIDKIRLELIGQIIWCQFFHVNRIHSQVSDIPLSRSVS